MVRARFSKIGGRVLGGMQVTVWAHFCMIDGRLPGAVWGADAGAVLGCCLGCCLRGS